MLKANRKTMIITSILTILPMLIGIIYWDRLPDVMATHFGFNNEANGFSSKTFAVFGIPLILLAVLWLGAIVTAYDPKRQNISPKMFSLVLWIAPVISLIAAATMYPVNLGYEVDITFFSELLLGLMFIIIGNYLPKARQNYTIGIKIPGPHPSAQAPQQNQPPELQRRGGQPLPWRSHSLIDRKSTRLNSSHAT